MIEYGYYRLEIISLLLLSNSSIPKLYILSLLVSKDY